MARWRRLPALGGLGELWLWRAALHFLSAAVLVPRRGPRSVLAVEGGSRNVHFSLPCARRGFHVPAGTVRGCRRREPLPRRCFTWRIPINWCSYITEAILPNCLLPRSSRSPSTTRYVVPRRVTTAKRLPGVRESHCGMSFLWPLPTARSGLRTRRRRSWPATLWHSYWCFAPILRRSFRPLFTGLAALALGLMLAASTFSPRRTSRPG